VSGWRLTEHLQHDSVTHYSDGKTEILKKEKETDEALMAAQCWTYLGAKPFEDPGFEQELTNPSS
jgi:hypothetical protein